MSKPLPADEYRRISLSIDKLQSHYDAIVIGSGYGGSVAALRLSQARRNGAPLKVALLERGREIGPGGYPATLTEFMALAQFSTPLGVIGPADGLFDFRTQGDVAVVQGCGLGGTSLINAGLAAEPLPWVMQDRAWPQGFRDELPRWPEYVARARHMLQPAAWPEDRPAPGKLAALRTSGEAVGQPCVNWPVNVTYEDGVNHAGVKMRACDGCGDCVMGCNRGAKNTTLFNYLPLAAANGVEIFCQAQVANVTRVDEHWQIRLSMLGDQADLGERTVTADLVVMGAGTLGNFEILARSRQAGLTLSDRLGHQLSGNGDALGFGYNTEFPIGALGVGDAEPDPAFPPGPCIDGVIDLRDREEDRTVGSFIMNGVLPKAFLPTLPLMLDAAATAMGTQTGHGAAHALREIGREIEELVLGPKVGALHNTQTYLVMSHDDSGGILEQGHGDRAHVHWPHAGNAPYLEAVERRLKECTAALGGIHVPNPVWNPLFDNKIITCHPLGSCAMGEDATNGVTDAKGRVFSGSSGVAIHPNLWVADAALIPRALGVNPLLTITALAERTLAHLLAQQGWSGDPGENSTL